MGLRRYRQFNLPNSSSIEINSSIGGDSIGVAMSISRSATVDLEVSVFREVSISETETDDPGVSTFREESDITVSFERETEDCQEQNGEKDIKNTTQVQLDEEDECTVKVSQIAKNQTGTDHVNDKTGENTTLVDGDFCLVQKGFFKSLFFEADMLAHSSASLSTLLHSPPCPTAPPRVYPPKLSVPTIASRCQSLFLCIQVCWGARPKP